jgi:hypothetical protein
MQREPAPLFHSKSGASRFKLNPSPASGYSGSSGQPRGGGQSVAVPDRDFAVLPAYEVSQSPVSYGQLPLCGGNGPLRIAAIYTRFRQPGRRV